MLLALLVYAYCTGQRSSRQIERLCEVDVAYRVVCAGRAPDHTTIARFRQDHADEAARLFTDALVICREAGLATVGVVAVDGTKMAADASRKANRTRAQIERQVREVLSDAEQVDAAEDARFGDARGDELPQALRDRGARGAVLDAALREVRAREHAQQREREEADAERAKLLAEAAAQDREVGGRTRHDDAEVAELEARLERVRQREARRRAEVEARAAARGRSPGPAPVKPRKVERAKAALARAKERAEQRAAAARERDEALRVNVTDPDSRLMSTANGWVQGYNAQAAVNDHGVVVAADVTSDHGDVHQCLPMLATLLATLTAAGVTAQIGTVLFDAGYWSHANAVAAGPDRLIATTKDWKRRKQLREQGTVTGPPPRDASPTEAMEHRLCTAEGAALYAKRGTTVEPAFGDIKHNRGFRRFMRRGRRAVHAEWQLITATGNLLRAYHHTNT